MHNGNTRLPAREAPYEKLKINKLVPYDGVANCSAIIAVCKSSTDLLNEAKNVTAR